MRADPPGRTLASRLADAAAILAAAGVDQPRREARILLSHATGLDQAALLNRMQEAHPAPGYDALVSRRAGREPMALIVGHHWFWTLDLLVSPDTLIPRPDSETLIEVALQGFPNRDVYRILDLGTGTGCLLLAALREFPGAFGVGVDRNAAAARLAAANAVRTGLAGRASMVCGDWAAAIGGVFDLVFCNPPYIESAAIASLMPEVARYEPALALDGGPDGLAAYRAIVAALPGLLVPGGIAILELGTGLWPAVAELAAAAGLEALMPRDDLAGIPRAFPLRRGPKKTFGEPGHDS